MIPPTRTAGVPWGTGIGDDSADARDVAQPEVTRVRGFTMHSARAECNFTQESKQVRAQSYW